ncbi:integrase family protein [Salinisphaera sp. S4-8]|uniref:tyrosine-type recombinase/integrase n=1 Tax=Salinisphaera sp. S4-8 TaxID=633357 RepID=UPI0033416F8F
MAGKHKLTDRQIKTAKPGARLPDGRGLYVKVNANGAKYFRFDYRFGGKRKTMALGVYPDTTLANAREAHQAARTTLTEGIDPMEARKAHKRTERGADTFEAIAREWYAEQVPNWSVAHADKQIRRFEIHVFPFIGDMRMDDITPPVMLDCLRRIVDTGRRDTAKRVKGICSEVFCHALASGRAQRDPTPDLKGALPQPVSKNHASLQDPADIGGLLRAIDGYYGNLKTRCVLKLLPMLFLRSKELRGAEWREIDLEAAEWRLPLDRMKGGRAHIVPLPEQAIAVFREIEPLTGRGRLVFPNERSADRPMTDNAPLAALRRMGFGREEMSVHGFRTIASTLLNEQGWHPDAIERQLAHVEGNAVRAAYNKAQHLPERRQMMQAWADYLDRLREGKADKVVPLHAAAR